MSGWGPLCLVIGALVITFTLGRLLRKRLLRSAQDRPQRRDTAPPPSEGGEHRRNAFSPEGALKELERSAERRVHTLRALIDEADERIRRLSALTRSASRDEALSMHSRGVPAEDIAEVLDIPLEQVREVIAEGTIEDQA